MGERASERVTAMNFSTWLIFLTAALISVLSPGPAILLAISNSMLFGLRKVVLSSLGNIAGLFLLSSAAMVGLGVLLKTSAVLFTILKIVGACYLVYLGIRQWRSRANLFRQSTDAVVEYPSNWQFFAKAFFVATTNPKPILFFTALFPQFINPERALAPQFLVLTGTFMGLSFCTLMGYAMLARSAKDWFSSDARVAWFNRTTGAAFVLLGMGVLRLRHAS
jgi:homoserine/homoserine lactone efflux protein